MNALDLLDVASRMSHVSSHCGLHLNYNYSKQFDIDDDNNYNNYFYYYYDVMDFCLSGKDLRVNYSIKLNNRTT